MPKSRLFPLAKRLPRFGPVTPLGRAWLAAWCLLLLLLGASQAALVILPKLRRWGQGEGPVTPAAAPESLAPFEPESPFLEGLSALPAAAGLNQIFDLERYRRLGQPWLEPREDAPLLTPAFQARKAADFLEKYLGPWDPAFLNSRLVDGLFTQDARVLDGLREEVAGRRGFGPNFRPYEAGWLQRLRGRVLPVPRPARAYQADHRAVTVQNAPVRLLPTAELYLHGAERPGQSYPFDLFQESVLWAGTPVYILEATPDRAWSKVLSSDCYGWVRTESLAPAREPFLEQWRQAIAQRGLAAVVDTEAPVTDARGQFRFQAYVGAVYPQRDGGILIPARDAATGEAVVQQACLAEGSRAQLPWACTPRHAARLWKTLLGRPYGWGNLDFHNDCSAELKAFFAPFGLWLPRNSAAQRQSGRTVDLSGLGLAERIRKLRAIGRPYRTLVWIEGHIMLYLGPVDTPDAHGFMTYQNLWGLSPRTAPFYRKIIGGSVLFPVLDRYPEAPELDSLAHKRRFVLTQLDGG